MDISMENAHEIVKFPQFPAYLIGQDHRTMLSPGAAESDGQIAFSFLNIPGN
jgi:hypothetical protein